MILPYISGIGIRPHFVFLSISNVSLVHVWWCLFVSGVPGNSLGFHNPNFSDTGSETFLVPNYTIRYCVRGFFPVANLSNTTKKWKFLVPVRHTVARVELNDPSVGDILKDWAACAERMKPQPRLSVIPANVNLKLEENLVRNHRNAMTPQDSLGISKIKLYLHDGPVYRWYNWYKNYLPGDDGTLRRV